MPENKLFEKSADVVRGVVVITTAQLHSTKSELRFCALATPAPYVSKICNGEDP